MALLRDYFFRFKLVRLLYRLPGRVSSRVELLFRQFLYRRGFSIGVASHSTRVREVVDMVRPREVSTNLVRVGSKTDGGYLLPDDLEGLSGVLSPGVGQLSDFELYFADRNVDCLLVDGTVRGPAAHHARFSFVGAMVGACDDNTVRSIPSLVAEFGPRASELLLQMDIEGGEWATLAATPANILERFRIIVIEFHDLVDRLRFARLLEDVAEVFSKLTATHVPVHFHPNNFAAASNVGREVLPDVFELTLIRKDRVREQGTYASLPHPLDTDNAGVSRGPGVYPSWWARKEGV